MFVVSVNKHSYSAPLIEKILRDAIAKGGELVRAPVDWRVDIAFRDNETGKHFLSKLPKPDKE